MRFAIAIFVLILLTCGAATAGERYSGFLTFGCGDRYIKLRNVPQTWYVNMSAEQEREMFRLARFNRDPRYTWLTLHVALDATRRPSPHMGYFGEHPQQLQISRVLSARFPNLGETVEAAVAPPSPYRGFLLVHEHGMGFVPLTQKDEFWLVVGGPVPWAEIEKHFRSAPDRGLDHALVEVVGRVGPPSSHDMSGGFYNREMAIDAFKFIRQVGVEEMEGTPAVGWHKAEIDMCKPQQR